MTFVPYPGVAPAVNALLGGHVTSALTTYSSVAEQLKAGKLRVLAAASRTRIEALPDEPTVAQSVTRASMSISGTGWWRRREPRRIPSPGFPACLLRQCGRRRSRQSSPRRGSTRWIRCTCAGNTRNMAA
jgi:hypothetical protein